MRVLITNYWMRSRTGTELYAAETARSLRAAGHEPMVLAMHVGELADSLAADDIPVFSDVSQIPAVPDVIHGQHNVPVAAAMYRFPGVPVVCFCHDATHWLDTPPAGAVMTRYVAVGEACRDRLTLQHGVPPGLVVNLPNAPDLDRFTPRAPLPSKPKRALAFSNYWSKAKAGALEEACRECGLELDIAGFGTGTHAAQPEALLGGYDVVFAIARCAFESLAVGTAVVLCGVDGVGPMVTREELDELVSLNLGRRTLRENLNTQALVRQIRRYDPRDTGRVSERVRADGGLRTLVGRLIELYGEAIGAGGSTAPDPAAFLKEYDRLKQRLHHHELGPIARENYELRSGLRSVEELAAGAASDGAPIAVLTGVSGSGTELLHRMLRAHPAISSLPETGEGSACGFSSRAEFLAGLAASSASRPLRLAASPAFCCQIPKLLQQVPEARIVHVIRDGRDIAAAMRRQAGAGGTGIREFAAHWARQVRQAQWDARRNPRCMEIRFEELVERPALTLSNVCAHLDLPYDGAMVAACAAGHWGPCPELATVGQWRRALTPMENDDFEREAGDLLGELGYLA